MTLRKKLIAINVFTLILMGLINFYQFNRSQDQQKIKIREGFMIYGQSLEESITRIFSNIYNNTQGFTKNETFTSNNKDKIQFVLNELVNLYQLYDGMIFVTAEGKVLAVSNMSPDGSPLNDKNIIGRDVSNETWFKDAVNGKFTEDLDKKIFGTRVGEFKNDSIIDELYGEEKLGQHFTAIIDDGYGTALGVLTTFAGERWIQNEIKSLEKALSKNEINDIAIRFLNSKNEIVISNKKAKSLDGNSRLINYAEKNGELWSNLIQNNVNLFSADDPLYSYKKFNNGMFVNSLGWQVLLEEESSIVFKGIYTASNVFSLTLIISLFLAGIIISFYSNKISNKLKAVADLVANNSNEINQSTTKLSNHSNKLSEASTEQASSLQQTAASIEEINAMVKRNLDNCYQSSDVSNQSKDSAETGQAAFVKMSESMNSIQEQNNQIFAELEENNKEIRAVIKVISDIEEKTKVINDIVFQTKLLSFNASVEAARAGEHGKGFAVVAEEVGNLAQMSGTSAKEISDMLGESIINVENIIESTTKKVNKLVEAGKHKIDEGITTLKENEQALSTIVTNVTKVDSMIQNVVNASQEQSQGLGEIATAMNELDGVTQNNSDIALKVNDSCVGLGSRVQNLNEASTQLADLIDGTNNLAQFKEPEDSKSADILEFHKSNKVANNIEPQNLNKTYHPELNKVAVGSELVTSSTAKSEMAKEQEDEFEDL